MEGAGVYLFQLLYTDTHLVWYNKTGDKADCHHVMT